VGPGASEGERDDQDDQDGEEGKEEKDGEEEEEKECQGRVKERRSGWSRMLMGRLTRLLI
jgi:hypothetical protein